MSKVTFIVRAGKGRIRNVSPRPRLGQDQFRKTFTDARPLTTEYHTGTGLGELLSLEEGRRRLAEYARKVTAHDPA